MEIHNPNINCEAPDPFALSEAKGLITRCSDDLLAFHAVRPERSEGFNYPMQYRPARYYRHKILVHSIAHRIWTIARNEDAFFA